MTSRFDIDAYFSRIGYDGSRAPTLATLRGITAHHTQTLPFENLNPLLRRPVRLDIASLQQKLLHEGRGGYCDWWMQGKLGDTWRMLYRFDLQRQYACDYEAPNWYTSTHPDSYFLHNLLCARVTPDGRYALFNRELTEYPLHGPSVTRRLHSAAEIADTLREVFKITLPRSPEVDDALNRLATADHDQEH